MDWVQIVHSSSSEAEPATVTKEAYEETWKALGWKLYKPPSASKEK